MPEFVRMPSTLWTQISEARRSGGSTLDGLLRKYRPPVYAFIRNMGIEAAEVDDLTQEAFLRIIEDDVLVRADRTAGRFRSFLLAVVRHTVLNCRRDQRRLKRGGGARHVSLEGAREEGGGRDLDEVLAAPPERDERFDPLWIQNLVRLAMERLQAECERSGRPYHRALMLATDEGLGYEEIAGRLGAKRGDVKNWLHQARLRLKRHVLAEIREYSSTRVEYEAEVAYLTRLLQ